jgi:hypothetical protein
MVTRLSDALSAAPEDRPLLHPNLAAVYRARIDTLEAALRDPNDGREAFERLRMPLRCTRAQSDCPAPIHP